MKSLSQALPQKQEEDVDEQELLLRKNLSADSRGRVHAVSSKKKIEEPSGKNLNGIDIEFEEDQTR